MLHQHLKHRNQLTLDNGIVGALIYPYFNLEGANFKKELIKNKIYVATYWPNVLLSEPKESAEYKLANLLVNLPIDQRYSDEDMFEISKIIIG